MNALNVKFHRGQFETAGFRQIKVVTVSVEGFEDGKAARVSLSLEAMPGDQGEVRAHLVDDNGPHVASRNLKRRALPAVPAVEPVRVPAFHEITVRVTRGVVDDDIEGIPPGCVVRVVDYDGRGNVDHDGDPCSITMHAGPLEPPNSDLFTALQELTDAVERGTHDMSHTAKARAALASNAKSSDRAQ